MLQCLVFMFLGLVLQKSCSLTEATEQGKRCDKKSVLTIMTKCEPCWLHSKTTCPDGYKKIINGSVGIRDCRYTFKVDTYSLALSGCRHICRKNYLQPQCCPGYWGPDCMECPGGAESPCSGRGSCAEGMDGSGNCFCQEGFGGTACETCAYDYLFGPNCSSVCKCVHGVCNSGLQGDGSCECYSAYTGPSCDTPVPECEALLCPENSRCSPVSKDETKLECRCLPNYEGDGRNCEPINPCLQRPCHPSARCTYLGPNQYNCTCGKGHVGDGRVCLPVDPCQTDFGNCPPQSTVCKYDWPGQSHCECKEHYHNFVPGFGCSMTNICKSKNPCHRNANCTMIAPGQTKCTCQNGYVGDGFKCYGNIMERLQELNTVPRGKWQGKLTSFISLLDKVYAWQLSTLGPFTLLLPSESEPTAFNVEELLKDPTAARNFVQLHIIAGPMDTEQMNSTDTFYTLTGAPGRIFNRDKDNQIKLELHKGKKKVKIVEGNIIASNGLIHILDTAMDKIQPTFESNSKQTIMAMIPSRYRHFRTFLEKTNLKSALDGQGPGGPYTVFVPSDEALNNLKDGALHYLLSPEGSPKLLELVRYHIVPSTQLEVAILITKLETRTMANQIIQFNVTDNGRILANNVTIEDIEVTAKNGQIYTLAGVLIPPSIVPILPHRCDEMKSEMRLGSCVNCMLKSQSKCPADTEPTEIFTDKCIYSSRTGNTKNGCARHCNATVRITKCCKGFFGPYCNQCPGGFRNPCSGNGQCADGVHGNGTCTCKDGFSGSRCQFCSDPNKYGPQCDKKCPCLLGTCDNRVDSNGACLAGTCQGSAWGKFCNRKFQDCGLLAHFCHVHATCELEPHTIRLRRARDNVSTVYRPIAERLKELRLPSVNQTEKFVIRTGPHHSKSLSLPFSFCVCKDGYEGNGLECFEKNPCAEPDRGGCSQNAECIKTGPGTHTCVCQPGWTGSGRDCAEINPCLQPSQGGCHRDATCLYVGPGQNECECQKGFRGNGIDCEPTIACLDEFDKCHPLATCQAVASGVWDCVCLYGYKGDGILCYGSAAIELLFLFEAVTFTSWVHASLQTMLSTSSNFTILVPSQQAVEDMDQDAKNFWLSRSTIPVLIKYHILLGTYSVTDLHSLPSSHMLATSLQGSFLCLQKADGNVTIGGATIIDGDIAATNGVIHIINKVLVPPRSQSGILPNLLTRLDQMPDYSIFRGYIIHYNLANVIEAADAYTVFAPNNAAIENYTREKKVTTLEEDTLRYHVVLKEKLLKNDLRNGMHRETMLGPSYLLGFFLRNDQLYVNEAPINYTNVATDKGVIHGLETVLEIQKNRCDNKKTNVVRGTCGKCPQPPICPPGTKLLGNETSKCIFSFYFMGRRSVLIGCRPMCVRVLITRACCAGFFGPQCQACPGQRGGACFGNGICMDGVNGTGTCKCSPGFNGTACETCADGKYGVHCDQECSCVHGRCNQGPSGDGSCDCYVGWRGVRCDSAITEDRCNGTCHTSANCLLSPDGKTLCRCAAGFQGNGTVCKAINACETRHGGCSPKADCKRTSPGNRVCVCKAGYTGDGIVCLEINPCLENHGGCDGNAECTHTGPNQAVCNCLPTYTGDGKACTLLSVCLTKNGGCSPNAICNQTGTGERTCTCKQNYTGDGLTCRGSIYEELPKDPQTSQYFFQLQEHEVRELARPGPFTVFVPASAAFNVEPQIKDWDRQGLMPQVLRYHVVACHQLLLENMKLTPNVTSLQGEPIVISVSQDTVYINNKAKIISSNIISTNGVVHVIDKLLSPQNLLVTPRDASGRILQNLTTVATNNGYRRFSKLLQDSGLLSVITNPIHTPVTVFWPTDQALQALPQEQQNLLFNQNKDKLNEYLKFHVIRDSKVLAADLPRSASWKTLQGAGLSVQCGAGSDIGELFLNNQMCRIVQRELLFDLGVAYGIDCLLRDPTVGGRCNNFAVYSTTGNCGSCLSTPRCPRGTKPQGMKIKCLWAMLPFRPPVEGCKNKCALAVQLHMCCKGYFLPDCQACPGGPDTPCNNRGTCLEWYSAKGQCRCDTGFNGTACELCGPGRFGPDCQPCGCSEHGQCDEGILGSGQCLCDSGWTGRLCNTRAAVSPVCTPPCSAHATCVENNTCECNLNYEGDGITCTVVNFCKQNNGGCANIAQCSQKGTKVSCSCPKGYQGDGHSCMEIDPCTDGLNGGCHEHATCTMTGPGKHRCECKSHYVGDGLDCEPERLPLDRCLQDNGHCHADADCTDLHFQDTTVGVFHIRSPVGQYKLTFDKARVACANEAATLATYNQLSYAQKAGYHLCSAGWLDSGRVAYPTAYASQNCGRNVVGIVDYGLRPNKSEMWDVFCYRMKDVNCTCKAGYVGDGFSCSGNLLQVLMSLPLLKNFLTEVLAYSNRSARGRAFLRHLTDLSIHSTLFVPLNSELGGNETLSGRDIEYHLITVSTVFYDDLVNGTTLQTRLGSQLLITSDRDQISLNETRFVDGRAIVLWDIFASNGIIHIISRPLKAPPAPATSTHAGLGTGIFFGIILVAAAIALAVYSYFRLTHRAIGFQRFESEEDINFAALGKQRPENISNPMYNSRSVAPPPAPCDPLGPLEELDSSDLLGTGAL
ncbi:PREDICTED: stabilin-2 isoform X2 [Chinchilla lanigera]|uniref:stabilin-2 isoform X2 n=1 Tax=Chinchilla lanigera TaxID=34839 RepID=UPI00038E9A7A|nr:PREDICTED: stabilin-2 isoform X2 [Chinchilla lanigera]